MDSPEHLVLVEEVKTLIGGTADGIVTSCSEMHPLPSLTVTEYVPEVKPEKTLL